MEIKENLSKEQEIITILFKDIYTPYNSRSISKVAGITHAGAFKILKRLEKRGIVKAQTIGKAIIYTLNFDNPITNKEIELSLLLQAHNYKRWLYEFKELEDKVKFAILFGSILIDEKKARDIDLLVVAERDNLDKVREIIKDKNTLTNKKIHLISQLPQDFNKDLQNKNKVMVEIIKRGVVLFGSENIRKSLSR